MVLIMSGITAATDTTEMMYCQFSVVTQTSETIKIENKDQVIIMCTNNNSKKIMYCFISLITDIIDSFNVYNTALGSFSNIFNAFI